VDEVRRVRDDVDRRVRALLADLDPTEGGEEPATDDEDPEL